MNKNLIYYLACTIEQSGWFSKAVRTPRRLVQQSGWFSTAVDTPRRLVQQDGWYSQQLLIKRFRCSSTAIAAAACDSLTHRRNPVQLSLTDWLTKWSCCSVRPMAQLTSACRQRHGPGLLLLFEIRKQLLKWSVYFQLIECLEFSNTDQPPLNLDLNRFHVYP
jgi:hypothetical protein